MSVRPSSLRSGWEHLLQYAFLIRLHRPIGIFLLLWPALWGLWVAADGPPPLPVLLVFMVGAVLMRSAGCVVNDYFDRDFDRQVARTRTRPLAIGTITPWAALVVAAVLAGGAFMLAWLTLNRLTLLLAIPAVLLALCYPLSKRWLDVPQVFLGIAFSWSIPMAFAAISGTVPVVAWLLFAANLCWTVGYDTLYAMADREDDRRAGVRSMAILCGRRDRVAVATAQALCLLLLAGIGWYARYHAAFYLGLLLAAGLVGYQQYLVRDRTPSACLQAFRHNNWFGAAVFAGLCCARL